VNLGRCGIFMSSPTRRLAKIMLADSAKLQNSRANDLLARAESDLDVDHTFTKPAYDTDDVVRVLDAVTEAAPYEEIELADCGVMATFLPVAHVLGSCAIRLKHIDTGRTLLYTGDLGPLTEQLLSLPDFGGLDLMEGADIVVMESTYGDAIEAVHAPAGRALPNEESGRRARSVDKLLRLMRKTIERGGFVLLPSFALGRTQELARLLGTHWGGRIPQAPLYIAGMGEQILDVYSDYEHYRAKGETQWVNPGLFPRTERLADRVRGGAAFVDVVDGVLGGPPGYILATPAAMGGGWSQWFAERLIADDRHAVAFTGYVPGGDRLYSLAALHAGSQLRCMDGSRRRIDCAWEKFSLSSHAQRADLLMFANDMVTKNGGCRIGVMHGTPAGQASLVKAIADAHGGHRAISLDNNREWMPTR
jgi:Cft2 family RNA processing exonuclease